MWIERVFFWVWWVVNYLVLWIFWVFALLVYFFSRVCLWRRLWFCCLLRLLFDCFVCFFWCDCCFCVGVLVEELCCFYVGVLIEEVLCVEVCLFIFYIGGWYRRLWSWSYLEWCYFVLLIVWFWLVLKILNSKLNIFVLFGVLMFLVLVCMTSRSVSRVIEDSSTSEKALSSELRFLRIYCIDVSLFVWVFVSLLVLWNLCMNVY